MKFISYHSCGYYGLFKPDLKEVCDVIPEIVFKKSEKIYVTTELSSGGDIGQCYVDFIDRHIGNNYIMAIR